MTRATLTVLYGEKDGQMCRVFGVRRHVAAFKVRHGESVSPADESVLCADLWRTSLAACAPQFVSPRLARGHLKHVSLQFGADRRVAPDYHRECLWARHRDVERVACENDACQILVISC